VRIYLTAWVLPEAIEMAILMELYAKKQQRDMDGNLTRRSWLKEWKEHCVRSFSFKTYLIVGIDDIQHKGKFLYRQPQPSHLPATRFQLSFSRYSRYSRSTRLAASSWKRQQRLQHQEISCIEPPGSFLTSRAIPTGQDPITPGRTTVLRLLKLHHLRLRASQ
jgi:hypothetical protein